MIEHREPTPLFSNMPIPLSETLVRLVAAAESSSFDVQYGLIRITDNIQEARSYDRASDAHLGQAERLAWSAEREHPEAALVLRQIRWHIAQGLLLDDREGELSLDRNERHAEQSKCACRERIRLDELLLSRRAQECERELVGRDEGE